MIFFVVSFWSFIDCCLVLIVVRLLVGSLLVNLCMFVVCWVFEYFGGGGRLLCGVEVGWEVVMFIVVGVMFCFLVMVVLLKEMVVVFCFLSLYFVVFFSFIFMVVEGL